MHTGNRSNPGAVDDLSIIIGDLLVDVKKNNLLSFFQGQGIRVVGIRLVRTGTLFHGTLPMATYSWHGSSVPQVSPRLTVKPAYNRVSMPNQQQPQQQQQQPRHVYQYQHQHARGSVAGQMHQRVQQLAAEDAQIETAISGAAAAAAAATTPRAPENNSDSWSPYRVDVNLLARPRMRVVPQEVTPTLEVMLSAVLSAGGPKDPVVVSPPWGQTVNLPTIEIQQRLLRKHLRRSRSRRRLSRQHLQ
jgi:hypothetical protein